MIDPEQVAAEIAARIEAADQEAYESAVAFAAGRFEEYFKFKTDKVLEQVYADATRGSG